MVELNLEDTVVVSLRKVPKQVLKGLDILAVAEGTNRSEYLRRILTKNVLDNLPEEMLKKL